MRKFIVAAWVVSSLISTNALSGDALINKISGTREAICFNHPNKNTCINGINALMKTAKAATDVSRACKDIKNAGGDSTANCSDAEDAVDWITSN